MITRILVPLDGSPSSEVVLGPVMSLMKPPDGSILLLHVVTPSKYFSETAAQYVRDERRRVGEYLQALGERCARSGVGSRERVVTGEVAGEIVAEAERSHADLIALSSRTPSGVHEWAFGSVSERVLRTTHLPVLVIRGHPGKSITLRKIVIALDGSEEVLEVVAPASELAAALHASVVLVHVGKETPPSLAQAQQTVVRHHVPLETRLLPGVAPQAILGAVEKEQADLLALTTTGKQKRDQLSFGTVAEEILKKCGRSLLVVHTGRTA